MVSLLAIESNLRIHLKQKNNYSNKKITKPYYTFETYGINYKTIQNKILYHGTKFKKRNAKLFK